MKTENGKFKRSKIDFKSIGFKLRIEKFRDGEKLAIKVGAI